MGVRGRPNLRVNRISRIGATQQVLTFSRLKCGNLVGCWRSSVAGVDVGHQGKVYGKGSFPAWKGGFGRLRTFF